MDFAKGPGAKFGRSNSLKWPWLYDKLVAKGYDHSTAAAISNSRIGVRKKGRLNVLTATQAHSPKVQRRIAADDKKGRHSTKKSLTSSVVTLDFFNKNHSKADGKFSSGSGGRSLSNRVTRISRPRFVRIEAANVKTTGAAHTLKALRKALEESAPQQHPIIKASEARGDSRPVSHEEFQKLASEGQAKLDKMVAESSPTTGLKAHWETIKAESYAEAQKPWGGTTIDSHTGKPVAPNANVYAITVKDKGKETVSVPENASKAEFDKAMDHARDVFGSILERQQHHLGVFHDDENHRIDIDPVVIVRSRADVDRVGAATRAIGGAYNFRDGNGYWPPHVAGG